VFNLMEDPWWKRLSGEQMDELLERVSGIRDLPGEDVLTVAKFVRCARAGECDPAEGTP
jgi:hypothetical protein